MAISVGGWRNTSLDFSRHRKELSTHKYRCRNITAMLTYFDSPHSSPLTLLLDTPIHSSFSPHLVAIKHWARTLRLPYALQRTHPSMESCIDPSTYAGKLQIRDWKTDSEP